MSFDPSPPAKIGNGRNPICEQKEASTGRVGGLERPRLRHFENLPRGLRASEVTTDII